MIYRLTIMIALSLYAGCSSQGLKRKIDNPTGDSLLNESLNRYSSQRLENVINSKREEITAVALCHQGAHEKGLEKLKGSFYKNNKKAEYWMQVANCYFLDKNYKKAVFYYNVSLSFSYASKDKAAVYNNLALTYLAYDNTDLSLEFLKKSLQTNAYRTAHFNIAQLYIKRGQLSEARTHLNTLYKQNKKDYEVLASLGTIALMRKDHKSASFFFSKIPNTYAKRQDISTYYALALFKQGNITKAKDLLEKQEKLSFEHLKSLKEEIETAIETKLEEKKNAKT